MHEKVVVQDTPTREVMKRWEAELQQEELP